MDVIFEEIYIRAESIKDNEEKYVVKDIASKYGGRYVDEFYEARKKIKELEKKLK